MIAIAGGILLAAVVLCLTPIILALLAGALFWIAALALSPLALLALPFLALRDAWVSRRQP